jgi:endonuclease/exonuclease/phosphatase family metal-dependent hydrolase
MRVTTFNIRHGESRDGQLNIGLLARTCEGFHADVLGLQEVDVGMSRSRWANLARRVARTTEMTYAFGPALRRGWFGRYGNALLARGSLWDVEELPLPSVAAEPRAAILAMAYTHAGTVSVASVHLSVHREERDQQLRLVLEALKARPLPRLLLGDLNGPPEDVAGLVRAAGLQLLLAAPTFPARAPEKQIDHVVTAGLRVLEWSVPDTPVSDHCPLVAELSATHDSGPSTALSCPYESSSPP